MAKKINKNKFSAANKPVAKTRSASGFGSGSSGGDWELFFRSKRGVLLLCALLFGVVVWTYWPSLRGQFMFYDEFGLLLTNTHVNSGLSWSNVVWALFTLDYGNWSPVMWLSHMLDFQLYGPNPWGHHLTNVLIHAGCAVLLFLTLTRMTGALWRSLIAAALFALH